MKKYIVLLAAITGAFAFSSCSEPKAADVNPSIYPTAKVEGILLINKDITDPSTPVWVAPKNVEIQGRVAYGQYTPGGSSGYHYIKGDYNTNTGAYSITFPVTNGGITVEVIWGSFLDTLIKHDAESMPAEYNALWNGGTRTFNGLMPDETRKGAQAEIMLDGNDSSSYTIIPETGDNVF